MKIFRKCQEWICMVGCAKEKFSQVAGYRKAGQLWLPDGIRVRWRLGRHLADAGPRVNNETRSC